MYRRPQVVEALVASCRGQDLDPRYLAFFECFNRRLYFEAHDVLEELWLQDRHGAEGAFYKGLIQLAGAFVHVQKGRSEPAVALFGLARKNLEKYPGGHQRLNVPAVLLAVDDWRRRLAAGQGAAGLVLAVGWPEVRLERPKTVP